MNFDSFSSTLPTLRMATIGNMSSSLPSPSITPTNNHSSIQQSKNTLWQGDLDPWMDENFIKQIWSTFGEHVVVKMIRDKFTGMNAGYCFVELSTFQSALNALQSINGTPIPGTNKFFKLNWASGGGINDKKDQGPEYSIFVGDLGPEVNDDLLYNTFRMHYSSCKTAKVVTDTVTGLSRGYGFVRFSDEGEQQRAMVEMQGQFCASRPMRISVATPKNRFGNYAYYNAMMTNNWQSTSSTDPTNTTVFVGGLTNNFVSEEELASYFAPFGPITYVKIPSGKGCGFVSFVHRQSAESALAQLNGTIIGGNRVRLSWGRNNSGNSQMSSPSMVASWKPVSNISPKVSPEKLMLQQQQQQIVDKQPIALKNAFNNNNSTSTPGFHVTRGIFEYPETDIDGWKKDSLPFEPITRPSSAFSLTSPFSQVSLSNHLRSAAGLPSPASSTVIRFASAPNSPEASLRKTPTPSGANNNNSNNNTFSVSSFF